MRTIVVASSDTGVGQTLDRKLNADAGSQTVGARYQIVAAPEGLNALEELQSRDVDLLVAEISSGFEIGIEIVMAARIAGYRDGALVLNTGPISQETILRAHIAAVDATLNKPSTELEWDETVEFIRRGFFSLNGGTQNDKPVT